MNHDQIIEYGLQKAGTTLRTPFDPQMPVLFVRDKMFALLGTHQGSASVNLKCDPDSAWLQRETYPHTILPGYHMNKRHWNTVILNDQVPTDVLRDMIDESYFLVVSKMSKRVQGELAMAIR
ncbi:MmcQ/YjbR family DNA-binding protein [Paenibacillus cremeus]|uniref:MmcQ/YjbR family DNA-binding protein n=1 Tax=Paenibacillus cremeus TaxID=2163881 RepID=A0A559KA82_9BACL|nr:MmcQ/YjbR family DNA-binding protein [Paenibacillus cremeus]TVY09041.1 MmcQ/YjbR family DNA-binding protein [Paenibacillus cremeus]